MEFKEYNNQVFKLLKSTIRKIVYTLGLKKYESTDAYRKIIPAEIKGGQFYQLIMHIASYDEVVTILEIGSSSGEGSTKALLDAARLRPSSKKEVHCLEISLERYEYLSNYLKNDKRFHAHRMSSVTTSDFPHFDEIRRFQKNRITNLSKIHIDTIAAWYKKDIQFIEDNKELLPISKSGQRISGIDWIKENYKLSTFDFVIIDGSEFTGMAEYLKVKGSNYIALDDVMSYKCLEAYEALKADNSYETLNENLDERNGWAIFVKKNVLTPHELGLM